MEEFSLEKWKSGDYDVVTRNGHSVRILCTDSKNERSIVVILSTLDNPHGPEKTREYFSNGSYYGYGQSELDLMLVKKKWQPKDGDWFYYIGGDYIPFHQIKKSCFDSVFTSHREMVLAGNCFRTEEEAQKKLREILEVLQKDYDELKHV